jgi:hypothetical protein
MEASLMRPATLQRDAAIQSTADATRPEISHWLAFALIAASGLYIFRWAFAPDMTFYADDWIWVQNAMTLKWSMFRIVWTILPDAIFHDRPMEYAIFKILYDAFGINYTAYVSVCLAIHIGNAALLYRLVDKLLSSRFYGLIAGVLFVIDYDTGYPGWWPSSLADSMSLFFSLCAFLAFMSNSKWRSAIGSAGFYWLAMKSKEAALGLPVLLITYRFLININRLDAAHLLKAVRSAVRSSWPVLCVFAMFMGFMLYYYIESSRLTGYGPYVPKFDVSTFVDGVEYYLQCIAFDLISGTQALIAFLVLTVVALWIFERAAILGSVGFFVTTGPVLFLANQRVAYYGYAAAAYISIMLVALARRAQRGLLSTLGPKSEPAFKAIVLATVVWFTFFAFDKVIYRDYQENHMRETSRSFRTVEAVVSHAEEKVQLVVTRGGGSSYMHAAESCRYIEILFKLSEYKCYLDGTNAELEHLYEELKAPKILLSYDAGEISVRARDP